MERAPERPPLKPHASGAVTSLIWGVSLAIHALVFLLVGGWVVFQSGGGAGRAFEGRMVGWDEEEVTAPPVELENEFELPVPEAMEVVIEAASAASEEAKDAGVEGGLLSDGIFAVLTPAHAAPAAFAVDPLAMLTSMQDIRGAAGLGSGGESGKGFGTVKGGKKGNLFGLQIQTTNQGILVFLDNSGSMREVAAQVEAMAAESFPDAKVVKIKGGLIANHRTLSRLRRERGEQDYYHQYYSSIIDDSILVLVDQMLAAKSTMPESIYMLSDFADYVDERAVDEFRNFLLQHKIKFYAHSVAKPPHEALAKLCRKTGGQVLVQPVSPVGTSLPAPQE